MKIQKMHITLERMKFYAYHGVALQETLVGNTFIIDLKLKVNFAHSLETDELADTVSYADVYEVVKEEMKIPSKLLEHVCGRIAKRLLEEFSSIDEIEIKLSKQNPPMGADMESASVILCCHKSEQNNS